MTKVLLVDDHVAFAESVQRYLLDDDVLNCEVNICSSIESAREMITEFHPDIVVLDVRFDNVNNGLRYCRELADSKDSPKVIVLSQFEEGYVIRDAYESGAKAYLMKSDRIGLLIEAIQHVMRGEEYHPPNIRSHIVSLMRETSPIDELSDEEREMLALMANGQTHDEIAKALGFSFSKASKMGSKIREKLGVSKESELTKIALKYNLITLD